jgi:hypothetical protein
MTACALAEPTAGAGGKRWSPYKSRIFLCKDPTKKNLPPAFPDFNNLLCTPQLAMFAKRIAHGRGALPC